MKKLLVLALVAICSAAAFAQNPDALKQIKKAKSAGEAKAVIEANEGTMSAAENAQAYNKLTDLYMSEVTNAQALLQANELAKQMGQEPKETVDMEAFYGSLQGALEAALACDKYDMQPNDKDKVAPKFRKPNGDRLYGLRLYLINGAQDALDKEDDATACAYYTLYVETGKADLFSDQASAAQKASEDGIADMYIGQVAFAAARLQYNAGNIDAALKLTDVMIEDPKQTEDGLDLKTYFLEKQLSTKDDSLRCLDTYKELYAQYPTSESVFSHLATMYGNLGMIEEQNAAVDQFLQSNPTNFTAWALKGQIEMNDQNYDAALTDLMKALSCEEEETSRIALVNTYVGYCYSQIATQKEEYEQQVDALRAAVPYLEKARELDPDRRYNWAYYLYNCYYHIKGEADPATEELRNMLGL
ncbi:MAG: hypothetical protein LUC22_03885 [Prevotella sp.]|nr:hypothetical protein [Prevotella sp.]